MEVEKGSGIDIHRYKWCFTKDVGDTTLTGRANSIVRKGGLFYSQFYWMGKTQGDALGRYPWDIEDDTMTMMALDDDYKEAYRSAVGAQRVDINTCRGSYNHCGRRVMLGVRLNDERSWGGREEHRITLKLFRAIDAELERRGYPEFRARRTPKPFYVHQTETVNMFTESIVLPRARWYQEILGMSGEGQLGVDRQKLAIMASLLLKCAYGSALIEIYPTLWEKKNRGEIELLGIGLKRIIEEYGFGWLPAELFDFQSYNFAPGIADHFPFPSAALQRRYESRKISQKAMTKMMGDVDLVTGRLNVLNEEGDGKEAEFLIHWLALRILKEYNQNVWQAAYRSRFEFPAKEHLRKELEAATRKQEPEVELTDEARDISGSRKRSNGMKSKEKKKHRAVHKEFIELPLLTYRDVKKEIGEPPTAVGKGRQWTTKRSIFCLLFFPSEVGLAVQDVSAQGWHDLPYLHGLNRATNELKDKPRFQEQLRDGLWISFDRYFTYI